MTLKEEKGLFFYDVIHVGVRDEEEVLGDCAVWATADVESYTKRREHDASLVTSD